MENSPEAFVAAATMNPDWILKNVVSLANNLFVEISPKYFDSFLVSYSSALRRRWELKRTSSSLFDGKFYESYVIYIRLTKYGRDVDEARVFHHKFIVFVKIPTSVNHFPSSALKWRFNQMKQMILYNLLLLLASFLLIPVSLVTSETLNTFPLNVTIEGSPNSLSNRHNNRRVSTHTPTIHTTARPSLSHRPSKRPTARPTRPTPLPSRKPTRFPTHSHTFSLLVVQTLNGPGLTASAFLSSATAQIAYRSSMLVPIENVYRINSQHMQVGIRIVSVVDIYNNSDSQNTPTTNDDAYTSGSGGGSGGGYYGDGAGDETEEAAALLSRVGHDTNLNNRKLQESLTGTSIQIASTIHYIWENSLFQEIAQTLRQSTLSGSFTSILRTLASRFRPHISILTNANAIGIEVYPNTTTSSRPTRIPSPMPSIVSTIQPTNYVEYSQNYVIVWCACVAMAIVSICCCFYLIVADLVEKADKKRVDMEMELSEQRRQEREKREKERSAKGGSVSLLPTAF